MASVFHGSQIWGPSDGSISDSFIRGLFAVIFFFGSIRIRIQIRIRMETNRIEFVSIPFHLVSMIEADFGFVQFGTRICWVSHRVMGYVTLLSLSWEARRLDSCSWRPNSICRGFCREISSNERWIIYLFAHSRMNKQIGAAPGGRYKSTNLYQNRENWSILGPKFSATSDLRLQTSIIFNNLRLPHVT